jgi:methionine aminotransferase
VRPDTITSKLPGVGVSIFTEIAAKARDANAVNLSQGFPDIPIPEELIDRIYHYMKAGMNQYAPGDGTLELRNAVSTLLKDQYHVEVSVAEELTITSGATEGLNDFFAALVKPRDEIIIIEPAYDAYVPGILINGGVPVPVKMKDHDFSIDWEMVAQSISSKTTAVLVNNPHNPTGSCLGKEDLAELEKLAEKHDLLIISDEVYNHLIFDGKSHESVLMYPGLRKRSIAVYSFGKTFHATGWKVGYVVAPKHITSEIRKVHQFVTFTVHTPTQLGLADYTTLDRVEEMNAQFQAKRDRLLHGLKGTKFTADPAQGTYFQTIDYSAYSDDSDRKLVDNLIFEKGLATIPLSPFYSDEHQSGKLRLCFAKKDETLDAALEIFQKL